MTPFSSVDRGSNEDKEELKKLEGKHIWLYKGSSEQVHKQEELTIVAKDKESLKWQ